MPSTTNGFATKKDLKKLEQKMDKRFEQVDKRFEQVDKRFEQVDKRFEEINSQFGHFRAFIKDDLDRFKEDTLHEFRHEWNVKIDPILADIEKHRDQEVIWAAQSERVEKLLEKIAKKVGVETEDTF